MHQGQLGAFRMNVGGTLKVLTVAAAALFIAGAQAEPTKLPDKEAALRIIGMQCDDDAFAQGLSSTAAGECRARSREMADLVEQLNEDPEMRPEFMTACANFSGWNQTHDYGMWAQCATFAKQRCPASSIVTEDDYKRCGRAIMNMAWLPASQRGIVIRQR